MKPTKDTEEIKKKTSFLDLENVRDEDVDLKTFSWKVYYQEMKVADDLARKEAPKTEPYKFYYESRKILQKYAKVFVVFIRKEREKRKCHIHLGKMLYQLGVNYYISEDVSTAQGNLMLGVQYLRYKKDDPNCVIPFDKEVVYELMDTYNYLGIIWFARKQLFSGLNFLSNAEKVYVQNITGKLSENEAENEEMKGKMELGYTFTCFYLTQCYIQLGNKETGTEYSLKTLKRQYEQREVKNPLIAYDPVEWAINSATLSMYFFSDIRNFSYGQYLLKCARKVFLTKKEKNEEAEANIFLLYGDYHLNMLLHSKDLILQYRKKLKEGISDDDEDLSKKMLEIESKFPPTKTSLKGKQQFTYVSMDDVLEGVGKPLPVFSILTKEEALETFKKCRKCIKAGMKYYAFDGFASDFIKITQKLTRAYQILSFWENDFGRRVSLLNKRAELLIPILKILNEKVYKNLVMELSYELGETYSSLMEEYVAFPNKTERHFYHINNFALKCAETFKKFQSLFKKDGRTNVDPENYQPYITSIFQVATAYFKAEPQQLRLKRKFNILAIKEYKKIGTFAGQNNLTMLQKEDVRDYLRLSKELENLIPYKIEEVDKLISQGIEKNPAFPEKK